MPYTISFPPEQEKEVEELRVKLNARSRPEAIAKAMKLAQIYHNAVSQGGKLIIQHADGKMETILLV